MQHFDQSPNMAHIPQQPSVIAKPQGQALRESVIYYIIALSLACVTVLFPTLLVAYMFTPALAALIMLFGVTREGYHRSTWRHIGMTQLGLRAWLPAIVLPFIVLTVGYIIVWTTGIARPLIAFSEIKWLNTAIYVIALLVLNTCLFSLGEELGWRGYLISRLAPFGTIRAHLLIGIGWAVWHYPLIFLGNNYYANTDGNRVLLTGLFTVTVIALSIVIGEFRLRSKSVWVASLFHSSHNVIWGLLSSFTLPATYTAYVAGESGIIPLVLYLSIAAILIWQRRGEDRRAEQKNTRHVSR